jgi:putative addiction module component (TIGR02574 family)
VLVLKIWLLPQQILEQALELNEEERAELASLLIESLDEPAEVGVEAAWVVEIERRMADLDSGSAKTLPWDEVREKLHGRLIA